MLLTLILNGQRNRNVQHHFLLKVISINNQIPLYLIYIRYSVVFGYTTAMVVITDPDQDNIYQLQLIVLLVVTMIAGNVFLDYICNYHFVVQQRISR